MYPTLYFSIIYEKVEVCLLLRVIERNKHSKHRNHGDNSENRILPHCCLRFKSKRMKLS